MQENIINLIDENGVESQFEIILTLEAEGKEYAILMPVEEEEAEEALVFRIDQDEQGEILVPLEDDKEYEIVVDVYNTLMEDISPNPSLGYIIPPTPGNTLPCASLDVSIANVRNSNLLLIDSGNSFCKFFCIRLKESLPTRKIR